VHVDASSAVVVRSNQAWRTMRAISVHGSDRTIVHHNLAEQCDTGVLVEHGASGTEVTDNWLHDCRVGVRCWDDRGTVVAGNAISAPREHAVVTNGPVELRDNDLGGGDVWRAS
jgi:nitrous oxidase accessory protein NosD